MHSSVPDPSSPPEVMSILEAHRAPIEQTSRGCVREMKPILLARQRPSAPLSTPFAVPERHARFRICCRPYRGVGVHSRYRRRVSSGGCNKVHAEGERRRRMGYVAVFSDAANASLPRNGSEITRGYVEEL